MDNRHASPPTALVDILPDWMRLLMSERWFWILDSVLDIFLDILRDSLLAVGKGRRRC